ncbi:MAG: hypothetical protein LBS64_05175 [Spirochaetaceae bacterium]|jgi:hypothetical protein|nr:hypothetical protein [Spirochaetaceae bacterium]
MILDLLRSLFHGEFGMTTYALVGESGTGKSFRSKLLAQKYGIGVIVDDGLLIQYDRILAGRSAKHEKTIMGAVRAALFDDKNDRAGVVKAMKKTGAHKVLVLGTSIKMVYKIASRLDLPAPSRIITIEEIATKAEIEKATLSRRLEGKHVIPVPAIEIKRKYPGIFSNAVRLLHRRRGLRARSTLFEKSVVRPEFSKKEWGNTSVEVLGKMAEFCVAEYDSHILVKSLAVTGAKQDGHRIEITIDAPFGMQLTGKIHGLQGFIINSIERDTGIRIEEVSIIVDKITY